MSASNFKELLDHYGHEIVIAKYTRPDSNFVYGVAIECETCNQVLLDYDNPNIEKPKFKKG